MKACIIQPPYSRNVSDCDKFFEYKMDVLVSCHDSSLDRVSNGNGKI